MNLESFLTKQVLWSQDTFGYGRRTKGILDHIKKELVEIENVPSDLDEWIDVVILALDGAWRTGYQPWEICDALQKKQKINMERKWPPIGSEDIANEHIRG